jgi:hypothetical protein
MQQATADRLGAHLRLVKVNPLIVPCSNVLLSFKFFSHEFYCVFCDSIFLPCFILTKFWFLFYFVFVPPLYCC